MTAQYHEIVAYLGDAAGQLTDEQIAELMAIADDIDTRYDTDDPEHAAAFAAAVAYMLGDTNLDHAARQYQAAKRARDEALAAAVQTAAMSGLSEVAAAERIGVNRRTLRRHLGRSA